MEKIMVNDVYHYSHCEDQDCSLGNAEFDCPCCESTNVDYGDVWWAGQGVDTTEVQTQCDDCNESLTVFYESGAGWKIKRTQ